MIDADRDVRMVLWLGRDLYARLTGHAAACGEPLPEFLRHRLTDSLPLDTVPHAAPRRGCAGKGEVVRAASPALSKRDRK
ncbi:hypothetical protein [Methylobacterium sp. 1030]|uniref:hypothetical protein n=1 Tax=Methylobacterium sp. 1030 TaxID=3156404 RepID=UPI00339A838A